MKKQHAEETDTLRGEIEQLKSAGAAAPAEDDVDAELSRLLPDQGHRTLGRRPNRQGRG